MLVCVCRWGKGTFSIFHTPVISMCTKAGIYKWGQLVTWATKFWMVVLNIFSIILAVLVLICSTVYQFICIEQWASDNGDVHIPLQNCGSPVWNLLHVTLQASRIWRWLLYLWETGGPYTKVYTCQVSFSWFVIINSGLHPSKSPYSFSSCLLNFIMFPKSVLISKNM